VHTPEACGRRCWAVGHERAAISSRVAWLSRVGCSQWPDDGDIPRRSWRAVRERGGAPYCPGLTGRSREALSVATVVKLYGEGDGDKEERLVLHAIGGSDRPGQECMGRSRLFFPGLG
jgi:hypothetical protein